MMRRLQAGLGIALSLCMGSQVFATGSGAIGNEAVSARSMGQGAIGVAGASDDVMTTYSNPAALSAVKGTRITYGLAWENLHGGYEQDSGVKTKMRSIDAVVPNFGMSHTMMDDKLGIGLAMVAPYGLESHWPGNGPQRYVATNSKLHMVDITPGASYQVNQMFAAGVGVDYMDFFDGQLEKNVFQGPGVSDGVSKMSGKGAGWGYHAGVHITPNEQNSFGIVYHSKVKVRLLGKVELHNLQGPVAGLFGGSDYETSAYGDLSVPANVQFGYSYKPTDKWMLEADAAWTQWDPSHDFNIRYAETNAFRLGALTNAGKGNPLPFDWRDAWSFSTGANYKASDKVQLRGGFFYVPHIQTESAFNPALNDLSRYGLGIGTGYTMSEHWGLDFAYNAVFFHNRHITNSLQSNTTNLPDDGSFGPQINGKYSDFANVVQASLTYKF